MQDFEMAKNGRTYHQTNSGLPDHRSLWPREAKEAFGQVLSELNSWCREFGQPSSSNTWVAETAVREAWAPTPNVLNTANPATAH